MFVSNVSSELTMASNVGDAGQNVEKAKIETATMERHTTTSNNMSMGGSKAPKIKNAYDAETTVSQGDEEIYWAFRAMIETNPNALDRLDHKSTMELLDNLSCPDDGLGCLSAWLPRYTKRTKLLLLATRRPAGTVRDKEMSDAVFGLMETEVELHQILHVMEHGPFDKMLAAEMMEKLLQAKVNIRKKIEIAQQMVDWLIV